MRRLNSLLVIAILCTLGLAGCGGAKDMSPTKKIEQTTKAEEGPKMEVPKPPQK